MPDSHRAAALRLAWARLQLAAGRTVWATPEVLTWEAWLTRQWRNAVARGAAQSLQLLSRGQERALWDEVLRDLAGDAVPLNAHTGGLMRAAALATQSLLALSGSAVSDEEQLLVSGLAEVRRRCTQRGMLALRLAPPEALSFLADVPAPLIAGEPRLSALQCELRSLCWDEQALLAPPSVPAHVTPQLRRFQNQQSELAGCADWCLARLRDDPAARLLVLSAYTDPSLAILGELLRRQMPATGTDGASWHDRLLQVEGGTVLHRITLIADALRALDCVRWEFDTEQMFAMLRSPYLRFGSETETWSLQGHFERWGLARWAGDALCAALAGIAETEPAAARLLDWLKLLRSRCVDKQRRSATDWARSFDEVLAAAGFNGRQDLDSREQQRFARWSTLLDEFASMDAVLAPLAPIDAVEFISSLAAAGRHQQATGDAPITVSGALGDPVTPYDGIWVLGLTESRWPAAPRPDAYVALAQQRAQHWPHSSVSERRAQALWALSCWQQRAGELVLSFAEHEGDLHHRPTALMQQPASAWPAHESARMDSHLGLAPEVEDQQFPPVSAAVLTKPLSGGVERLRIQQICAFRAQAQWRLKATAPGPLSDGVTALQRGSLLHAILQGVWGELRDQSALRALTPEAERILLQKYWDAALAGPAFAGAAWWAAGLRDRERERTLDLIAAVLRVDRARAPFTVSARESRVQWSNGAATLNLRIDRIDTLNDGARILLDYKSGATGRIKLQDGELEPLQLALYVAALAAQGQPVDAAALFSIKPGSVGLAGVTGKPGIDLQGLQEVADWDVMSGSWQHRLLQLLDEHLSGTAELARRHAECRYCHLTALCRRAAVEDVELTDE